MITRAARWLIAAASVVVLGAVGLTLWITLAPPRHPARHGKTRPSIASLKLDASIQQDSDALFRDDLALFSYVKKFGPRETVTRLNQLSARYGSCHDPAHKTGRVAYEFFGAGAFRLCGMECHSGCYHGVIEAYFKVNGTEHLADEFESLCSATLNPFFRHQCVHGIGHGLMAWTNYEILEALESCDRLPAFHASCWTGVFMENIGAALAAAQGHASKYLSDDPHYPCRTVPEKYRSSCYFLQTSRMMQLFDADFSLIAATCAEAVMPHRLVCFESMGRDVGGVYRGNAVGAIAACSLVPDRRSRSHCLTGAVQDAFWDPGGQENAIRFCRLLKDAADKRGCYRTLFQRAPAILASEPELRSFCGQVEGPYRKECLAVTRPGPKAATERVHWGG